MIDADQLWQARASDLVATAERLGVVNLKRVSAAELAGPCLVCAGRDRFSINRKQQLWHCRGCGKGGGDAISLVCHVRGLDFREAVAFLARGDATNEPARVRPTAEPDAEEKDAFVERLIADIVRKLVPVRRKPGEQYLSSVRKIDTGAIADVLERTDAIGWHPSVLFREQGHALDGRQLGCIVGVMTDPVTAMPTGAISRTYLTPDLAKVGKAKALGRPAGIVRLSADEDVLNGLCLAEGLETALAGMSIGLRPMWATGSTALMSKFPVLAGIECLNLIVDNDLNGAGERAAREAEARWRAQGREVRLLRSDAPGDLNDVLKEAAA
jgi:Toprim domain-containing protein/CHC2-type zinc finger protein